jgi:hypothetical protein
MHFWKGMEVFWEKNALLKIYGPEMHFWKGVRDKRYLREGNE